MGRRSAPCASIFYFYFPSTCQYCIWNALLDNCSSDCPTEREWKPSIVNTDHQRNARASMGRQQPGSATLGGQQTNLKARRPETASSAQNHPLQISASRLTNPINVRFVSHLVPGHD